MIAVAASAGLTFVAALILGQAACWLCGMRGQTYLAAPVGLALLLLVSAAAIPIPGHAGIFALLLALLVVASAVLLARERQLPIRPADVLAVAPVFCLALVPFIVNSRAGTLGVSVDNDMQQHLRWAEAIRSAYVAHVNHIDPAYPLGPHALCAVLAQALGIRVDYAFAGESAAVPVLLAWTAAATVAHVRWLGRAFVAIAVGLPFLVASYYAQGSFKEPIQALLVLGFALGLQDLTRMARGDPSSLFGWVPLALIIGASLSVYSATGLPWLLTLLVLWVLVLAVEHVRAGARLRTFASELRADLIPGLVGVAVLLVVIAPQLPRLVRWIEGRALTLNGIAQAGTGSGIPITNLGNLGSPISFWKVFGVWDVADYRLPASSPALVGVLVAFVLLTTLLGTVWYLRKCGWVVPLAAAVAFGVWVYADARQSPYVAAKGLVVLAPLLMLLATTWLVDPQPNATWPSAHRLLRVAAASVLGLAILTTSLRALRSAEVGPTNHIDDLRAIRPRLGRARTLFLGWDDFIRWELAGTPVGEPFLNYRSFLRPEKHWLPGQALDFDDIPPKTLDRYRYVIAPRGVSGSQPPSNMRLVLISRYYELWRREGPTPDRKILDEGQEPGAPLDCATPAGRSLAAHPGVAAVRSPNVVASVSSATSRSSVGVRMRLSAGRWWLAASYTSPYPVDVRTTGLHTALPANLDRPGNRWPVGSLLVTDSAPTVVTLKVIEPTLGDGLSAHLNALLATPDRSVRPIPLTQACGQYVDWYVIDQLPGRLRRSPR